MQDELLDIVNEQDEVVGTMFRKEAYAQHKTASLRGVWLFIKTQNNYFWIPKRSLQKELDPGKLEGAVVGHVSSGEEYDQAMLREALEEIGIDLSTTSYRCLGRLSPKKDGSFCMLAVYEWVVDKPFDIAYNSKDVDSASWIHIDDLVVLINNGVPIKKSLKFLLSYFYNVEF